MRLLVTFLALTATWLCSVNDCAGQSLWRHRTLEGSQFFFDTQARKVGDIVTVLINETTDVDNRDQRQFDREANARGGFNFDYGLGGKLGNESGNASMDFSTNGSGDFDGQSNYRVDREFADRITVTVVRCLPSGNLEIYGRRNRLVSGERRALVVSGIVRPLDIAADNTIESRFIAEFQVCYDGDGVESRFTKQGWLTEAWNKYRPF